MDPLPPPRSLVVILGVLTLCFLLFTWLIAFSNRRGWSFLPFRFHPVFAKVTILLALFHAFAAGSSLLLQAEERGEELFLQRCGYCHSPQRALSARKDRAEWERTLRRMSGYMAQRGLAPLEDLEVEAIVDHLLTR